VLARKAAPSSSGTAPAAGWTAFGTPRELAGHAERLLADTARAKEMAAGRA